MNNKGQMILMQLMIIVMAVLVFSALIAPMREGLDLARNQDAMNCKADRACSTSTEAPCYNSSKETESTGCAVLDLYLPYLALAVLIGGAAYLFMRGPAQPQMGGYQ